MRCPPANSALVVAGFYWKVLALEGFRPITDACAVCGGDDELVAFDLEEGGLTCREHRRGTPLSPEAIVLLRQILEGALAAALDAPASPATVEIEHLATRAMEHHLERRLRSVGLLDRG